jgi:hypothetical protein
MADSGGSERRHAGRHKVLKTGIALYGAEGKQMKCTLLDMSGDSAKLKPETHGVLPNRFTLVLQPEGQFECTVVRRSGYLLGVTLKPA